MAVSLSAITAFSAVVRMGVLGRQENAHATLSVRSAYDKGRTGHPIGTLDYRSGNAQVTICPVIQVTEYLDTQGRSPFRQWFDHLDGPAATKITAALDRMGRDILSSVKGVGAGVPEYRIDSGPGYRIYFGDDGNTLIVLLGGGTKKRQQRDIETAKGFWRDYRSRKREE